MTNYNVDASGIAYLPVAEGQIGPGLVDETLSSDASNAEIVAHIALLQAELNRTASLLQATKYRSHERLFAEAMKTLRIADVDFGVNVPVSGDAGTAYFDFSQPGDAVRPVIYGGDGPEESMTLFEALMLPLNNRINSLALQQVTQDELDAVESAALKTTDFDGAFDLRLANVTLDGTRIVGKIPLSSVPVSLFGSVVRPLDENGDEGTFANLTQDQLNRIVEGTFVGVSDGAGSLDLYSYDGAGDKRVGTSYTRASDTNPHWNQIDGIPLFGALAFSSDAVNLTGTVAVERLPDLAISKITGLQTALDGKANSADTLGGYGITNALTAFQINSSFVALNTPEGGQAINTNTTPGFWFLDDSGVRIIWIDNTNEQLKLGTPGRETLIRSAEEATKVDGNVIATRDWATNEFAPADINTADPSPSSGATTTQIEDGVKGFVTGAGYPATDRPAISLKFAEDRVIQLMSAAGVLYARDDQSWASWRALASEDWVAASTALEVTYVIMRAMSPSDGDTVWLNDWGGGRFVFKAGDQSVLVAQDEMTTGEGDGRVAVALTSDKTGATGAWIREDWLAGKVVQSWWWMIPADGIGDASDGVEKFCETFMRIGAYQFDGILLDYGKGELAPGVYNITRKMSVTPARDAVWTLDCGGEQSSILVGSADNLDGVLQINSRGQGAKASKWSISNLTILTKAQGCAFGLDVSDRSGGLGNGTQHVLRNVSIKPWDINQSYFLLPADLSGLSRLKAYACSFTGPLDPGMAVNDYSEDDTRFSPDVLVDCSGGYDQQFHDCIFQGGKIGCRYVQGATRDENGVREGYGQIIGSADVGGFLRLKMNDGDHGVSIGDQLRVSAEDSYQYHTANVTDIITEAWGDFILTDIPFTGFTTTGLYSHVIKQGAAGEGLGFVNCVFNHQRVGIFAAFAGQEASAVILRHNHFNCMEKGVHIDGGQGIRYEQGLPYNNHYPNLPNPDAKDGNGDFIYPGADTAARTASSEYQADLTIYNNAVSEIADRMIDIDLINVRQVNIRNFEMRATEHPSRTFMRVRNGPNVNPASSIYIENGKLWGSAAKAFDFSGLGTAEDPAVGIKLINIDTSGLQSGDVFAHFGPHCRECRATGHPDLPAGVTIIDETDDGALIVSEGDMKQLQTIRFEVDISTTIAGNGTYNAVVPNKIPHARYLIQAGPVSDNTTDSEILVAEGLVWSAAPHNLDDVRLNINNDFGSSRVIDSKWAFICTPFAANA